MHVEELVQFIQGWTHDKQAVDSPLLYIVALHPQAGGFSLVLWEHVPQSVGEPAPYPLQVAHL